MVFLLCAAFILGNYLRRQMEEELYASTELETAPPKQTQTPLPPPESLPPVWESEEPSPVQSSAPEGNPPSPEPSPSFTEAPEPVSREDFFNDTLFIGDSRTVGLQEYGDIKNATFFADSGMSVFKLEKERITIPELGRISFDEVLDAQQYDKIYLMLGINELGYRFENFEKKYKEILEKIRAAQGDAVIYLCANMHVSGEHSAQDEIYNNEKLDRVNEMIKSLADGETMFYLDVNVLFDDENGNLDQDYSSDSFHIYGKYYMDWVDWLYAEAAGE